MSAMLVVTVTMVMGEDSSTNKKHEKRGLADLGYGTLGGYSVGSGLTGYTGTGLAGLAIPAAATRLGPSSAIRTIPAPALGPAPVVAHAAPVYRPAPVYAPPPPLPAQIIGTSVHTTITKQVSLSRCLRVKYLLFVLVT